MSTSSKKTQVSGWKKPLKYSPMAPTYLKFFWENSPFVPAEENEIMISSFVLPNLSTVNIRWLMDREDHLSLYVICPQYMNKHTMELADCQISVTGTSFHGERIEDTCVREIHEETALSVTKEHLAMASHRFMGSKSVQNFWCEINNDTTLLTPVLKISDMNYPQDDYSRKIQAVVFGKIHDFEKIFTGTLHPHQSKDSDPVQNKDTYLAGIRMVSLIDVFRILENFHT
jgi:hypothetical protein